MNWASFVVYRQGCLLAEDANLERNKSKTEATGERNRSKPQQLFSTDVDGGLEKLDMFRHGIAGTGLHGILETDPNEEDDEENEDG